MKLIECIPNISEGRDQKLLNALDRLFLDIPHLKFCDRHSDPDHHRSVLTLIGSFSAIRKGMIRLCQWALEHIDMRKHQGVHPRIGAVDVVPLVPVTSATLSHLIERSPVTERSRSHIAFSRELAQELAEMYQLPIYLYEQSTQNPHRTNLAHIRRGEFEGLAVRMQDPVWKPDFGPTIPHPTLGATVVGVRDFLIAFNVLLDTPDVRIARAIAHRIRESSGGYPGVKALGIYLTSQAKAQVSMNIVNYRQIFLPHLIETIRQEAATHGVHLLSSELVGLIPQAALANTSPAALLLHHWRDDRILEYYL